MAVAAGSATATCLDVGVTIAVGIFELFTYAIPGSLYLAFFAYVVGRAHWIDLAAVTRMPVFLLVVAIVLISYLMGYLAYPVGELANKIVPRHRQNHTRNDFLRRNPAAKDREYVNADPFLLLAALQLHDNEVATDVTRLRATGLMLRNSAPPMLLAAIAAIVELFVGHSPVFASTCAVLFLAGFFALIVQARRLGRWASMRTLEFGFWLPDIDEKFRADS
ncbi:hypothetical protein JOF56_010264 [Kibdelosporangium banguiense]|uniref:Uncharacterized protein n=1 Tax=Kibdelosporangium banguiense TaxID=1365924 RepID=A0ABS4TZP2_9PSEU|nr:hypothetical protein [Kibdelosporangium banguiense]MBP2329879.1 hypothetical protein [Kibdelosporangium banguiense]